MSFSVVYTTETGRVTAIHKYSGGAPRYEAGEDFLIVSMRPEMPCCINDGKVQAIPPQPTPSHIWNWSTKAWESDLETAREAKWAEMQAARDAQSNSTFMWSGHTFQCDAASRADVSSYASRAQREDLNWSVDWRLADNTYLTLTGEDMVAVHDAMSAHIEATHATAKLRWDSIQAAGSVAAVEAVTWA